MKYIKRTLLVLLVILVVIQFIRPAKTQPPADRSADISAAVPVPDNVAAILRESCYDCHSDETRYPWYFEIQPVGWWMGGHIEDARRQLNFSDFASTRLRRQYHKLQEITEQIDQDEMPLESYLIIHRGAVLSEEQKGTLRRWVDDSRASMKERYPADSLERPRGAPGERPGGRPGEKQGERPGDARGGTQPN